MFNPSDQRRAIEDAEYEAQRAKEEAQWASERANEVAKNARMEQQSLREGKHETDERIDEVAAVLYQLQADFAKFKAEWDASKK